MNTLNNITASTAASIFPLEAQRLHALQRRYTTSITAETIRRLAVRQKFEELKNKWLNDIGFTSSLSTMTANRYYRQVISLGADVVPILLRELRDEPNYWFAALRELTNVNPVSPSHRGNLQKMANDWLEWAKAQNIVF